MTDVTRSSAGNKPTACSKAIRYHYDTQDMIGENEDGLDTLSTVLPHASVILGTMHHVFTEWCEKTLWLVCAKIV